jgi:ABC-type molybdate transport system substrate-binding protein
MQFRLLGSLEVTAEGKMVPLGGAKPQTLLAALLRHDIRLGTSTPGADVSGDQARALFRRAETVHPGAFDALDAKALRLTVGPNTPPAPPGLNTYAWVMAQGQADVFLTYCSHAVASQHEVPRLKVVQVPPELQVGAAYGLTVRANAPAAAHEFAEFVLSPPAQAVLGRLGFATP